MQRPVTRAQHTKSYLMVRATIDSSTGPRLSCSKWISSIISSRTCTWHTKLICQHKMQERHLHSALYPQHTAFPDGATYNIAFHVMLQRELLLQPMRINAIMLS